MTRPHVPASLRIWPWALGGALLGLLSALLVFAPARWLTAAVERISDQRVRLSQASGTVWAGSAQLSLTGGNGSRDAASLPGRLDWRLSLGWGRLQLELQAPCCTPQPLHIQATPRWDGLQLTLADQTSSWPAGLLGGLGTPWNTVQPEGQLRLAGQQLRLRLTPQHAHLEGQLQIDALALSSRLSTLKPMGSYRLTLNGGATPTLQLVTLNGRLQLVGQGQWVGARLRFNGLASAAPGHEAELSNLLNIMGRRSGVHAIITLG